MNTLTGLFRNTDITDTSNINNNIDEDDIIAVDVEDRSLIHNNSNTLSDILTTILKLASILSLLTFIGCVITFIIVSIRLTHSINKDVVPLANNITISLDRISSAIETIDRDTLILQSFLRRLLTSIKDIAKDIHKIAGVI